VLLVAVLLIAVGAAMIGLASKARRPVTASYVGAVLCGIGGLISLVLLIKG
jgi:hypothetical protein